MAWHQVYLKGVLRSAFFSCCCCCCFCCLWKSCSIDFIHETHLAGNYPGMNLFIFFSGISGNKFWIISGTGWFHGRIFFLNICSEIVFYILPLITLFYFGQKLRLPLSGIIYFTYRLCGASWLMLPTSLR